MITSYAVHARGLDHDERDIPCQDSFRVEVCEHGYIVAAVADGLGSCSASQISSEAVTRSLTQFVKNHFPRSPGVPSLVSLMITAFNEAERDLYRLIDESDGLGIDDLHTTLTACIFNGKHLIYGHSGDGILLGLDESGEYSVVCEPVKGQRINETCPFTYGSGYWHVNVVDRPFVSVLLATDGIGDILYPMYLRPDHEVLLAHASFFMHPNQLGIGGEPTPEFMDRLGKSTLAAIRDPDNGTWSEVTDDITAIVLINNEITPPEIEDHQTPDYLRAKIREFYTDTPDNIEESNDEIDDTPDQTDDSDKTPVQKRIAPDVNLDRTENEVTSEEQETEKKPRFSLFVKVKRIEKKRIDAE